MPSILVSAVPRGPMPNGEAEDPPVGRIALKAAQDIYLAMELLCSAPRPQAVSHIQIRIDAAIQEALDRCQKLGGRRVRP